MCYLLSYDAYLQIHTHSQSRAKQARAKKIKLLRTHRYEWLSNTFKMQIRHIRQVVCPSTRCTNPHKAASDKDLKIIYSPQLIRHQFLRKISKSHIQQIQQPQMATSPLQLASWRTPCRTSIYQKHSTKIKLAFLAPYFVHGQLVNCLLFHIQKFFVHIVFSWNFVMSALQWSSLSHKNGLFQNYENFGHFDGSL